MDKLPTNRLKMDEKIVKKDHKQYIIPLHSELNDLSPQAQELAYEKYLSLKPALDARQIRAANRVKKKPPAPKKKEPHPLLTYLLALTLIQSRYPAFILLKAPLTPQLPKEPTNQNVLNLPPGAPIPSPIPPVLMNALLRYNGAFARQLQNSPLKPTYSTAPSPFNLRPSMKPADK